MHPGRADAAKGLARGQAIRITRADQLCGGRTVVAVNDIPAVLESETARVLGGVALMVFGYFLEPIKGMSLRRHTQAAEIQAVVSRIWAA
jgi:hypothetical protein